jgi:hypothetical protein
VILRAKLSIITLLLLWPITATAASVTFQGLLLPGTFDPPIPITLVLSESFGLFSGRARTTLPLPGEGRISSGRRDRDSCVLTVELGEGRRLRLEGQCRSNSLDGKYKLYFSDGRRGEGTFRVQVLKEDSQQDRARDSETDGSSARSNAACLRVNAGCLAACPRGADSGELICVNACTRRLSACKNKVQLPPAPPSGG